MTEIDENVLRKKLISGAKWSSGIRFITQTISWITSIIIVRFLEPSDYGLNSMLEVPIEALLLISTLGMDKALIQKREYNRSELASIFGLLIFTNLIFFSILTIGSGAISSYFGEPRLVPLLLVTSAIFLLLPFRVIPNALLDREFAFEVTSKVELVAAVGSSLISLFLAIAGAGVWALVLALVLNFSIRAALLSFYKPWFIKPSFSFFEIRDLIKSGSVMTISSSLLVLSGIAVNLIIAPQIGPENLGYYAVALSFSLLPMSKVMPIVQQTIYPAFAALRGNIDASTIYLSRTIELTSIIIFPICVGTAIISHNLVITVFGHKWLPAALPLAILSLSTLFRVITNIVTPVLNAQGHIRLVFYIYLTMFLLLTLGAIQAAKIGITAIIILWVIVNFVICGFSVSAAKFKLNTPFSLTFQALRPALSCCVAMVVILYLRKSITTMPEGLVTLLTDITLGALTYTGTLILLFSDRVKPFISAIFEKPKII